MVIQRIRYSNPKKIDIAIKIQISDVEQSAAHNLLT